MKCLPCKPDELGLNLCKPHKKLDVAAMFKPHRWGSGHRPVSRTYLVSSRVSKEADNISEDDPKVAVCWPHESARMSTFIVPHAPCVNTDLKLLSFIVSNFKLYFAYFCTYSIFFLTDNLEFGLLLFLLACLFVC